MRQMRHILANGVSNGTHRSDGGFIKQEEGAAPPAADAEGTAVTAAPAGGDATPIAGPEGEGATPIAGPEGGAADFAPLGLDQSYTWMIQIILLMATMTFFFPFMRHLFGMKSPKRQLATFSRYNENFDLQDEEDEEVTDEE